MHREFLMGNEAMALGALAAGVNVVAGYPGTPSTEILETIARRNPGDVYVEWSVNEKGRHGGSRQGRPIVVQGPCHLQAGWPQRSFRSPL